MLTLWNCHLNSQNMEGSCEGGNEYTVVAAPLNKEIANNYHYQDYCAVIHFNNQI